MRVSRGIALATLALLVSAPAWADWKRDYVRGERALRDQNWAEAEALFRQSAREEPTPSGRKRFEGVVFRDYAPQFWAGYAAWKQGACDRAMEYWRDSANSPTVLAEIKDFKSQQDRAMADCQTRLAQAPQRPAAEPAAPVAPPIATTLPSQPATTPATTPVQAPTTRPAPVTQPSQQPAAVATAPTRPTPSTTAPAPATAQATAVTAPAVLTTVVEAWIAGRHADVLRTDASAIGDGRARAHVHLFRAAARHVEGELGDAASLESAREEIRLARRALATLSPDAALFSPRFRAFWQQTR